MQRQSEWTETGDMVRCADGSGTLFEDTLDHWRNGVCRLLDLSDSEARHWVELAASISLESFGKPLHGLDEAQKVAVVRDAWAVLVSDEEPHVEGLFVGSVPDASPLGYRADVIWASDVGGQGRYTIIGSSAPCLGWLVDAATNRRPERSTVDYDECYFEGKREGLGYGSYLAQQGWRLEKGQRLCRQVSAIAELVGCHLPAKPNLLDVGSGYGFFREAAAQRGWTHEGIELSPYAAKACEKHFGFPSFVGDLHEYLEHNQGTAFDVITMWDVVEHLHDPLDSLRITHGLLRPGGLIVLRTPNLDSLERTVFGRRYHSFKSEHLVYFSPEAIVDVLQRAGYRVVFMTTETHLLRGFLGRKLDGYARRLEGSDLIVAGTA